MTTTVEIKQSCNSCAKDIKGGAITDPSDTTKVICEICLDRQYDFCHNCDELTNRIDLCEARDGVIILVCKKCRDDFFIECDNCNQRYTAENIVSQGGNHYCVHCVERSSSARVPDRAYSVKETFVTKGKRPYSVEIECYAPSIKSQVELSKVIPKEIGIGRDGSLDGAKYGKEYQTPKLSGDVGDAVLHNLCSELLKNKFFVDKNCGLHIHLDAVDYLGNTTATRNLMLFYMIFEPVIFSYLPLSRRKNRFCMPLTEFFHEREILDCDSYPAYEMLWYRERDTGRIAQRKSIKDGTRYAGINFHSMFANGHLEIRYHSGTIQYEKIRNWLDLHIQIVEKVIKGDIASQDILDVKFSPVLEEKEKAFFRFLELPKELEDYYRDRRDKFAVTTHKNKNICAE